MLKNLLNKKWATLLLLTLVVGSGKVWGQQEKMFSQYMFNMLSLNPAYAGSRDVLSATGIYRTQWGGIEGAPKTANFSIDMPVNRERVGIGFQAFNDQLGLENSTGFYASYAFRIKLGERSTLALGLQGGATSYRWDLTNAKLVDGGGSTFDPAFSANISKVLPNFGTGIYLSNDRSYLGISVPNIIENNLSDLDNTNRAKQRRSVYMMGGFVIGKGSVKLKPSMLVKYINTNDAPLGIDGNLNVWFNERVAIGASYRYNRFFFYNNEKQRNDAIVGMLELQMSDQFRLGYSYDYTMNGLNHTGRFLTIPTHEIMLRYEFGFSKSKILTPRYF
jgi:type IX secretion system PorP/SprF family membrane protein